MLYDTQQGQICTWERRTLAVTQALLCSRRQQTKHKPTQRALAAKDGHSILSYLYRNRAGISQEVVIALYLALIMPSLGKEQETAKGLENMTSTRG